MAENKENLDGDGAEAPEAETAPPDIDSKYRMIILAAQRSKQIQRGASPRVEMDPRRVKPTRIAMREIQDKKVNFTFDD